MLRRPTTFRTSNVFLPPSVLSVRRVGEAPFDALQRQTVLQTRRDKDRVDINKVAVGRNALRGDSRLTSNPTGFSPGKVHGHSVRRASGPGFNRWGRPLSRRDF